MKERYDPWYIQMPDGRIVKAKSTASVRHHVEAGNIPSNSMARRSSDDEWQALNWIAEFSDLGKPGTRSGASASDIAPPAPSSNGSAPDINLKSGISARLDPMRLQTVGIRGFVDELIAAFDSTVSTGKLVVACTAGAIGALSTFLVWRLVLAVYADGVWLANVLSGIAGLAVFATVVALLTRQTHLELSTMRPVRPSEAWRGLGAFVLRVFLGYVATVGLSVGVVVLLHQIPNWVAQGVNGMNPAISEVLLTLTWAMALVLAVGAFAVIMLSLLVPPILVVEECSVGDAVREWRALLREHRTRVMVYEGMALALALIAALPLLLPVNLARAYGPTALSIGTFNWVAVAFPIILQAIAFGPALAFLTVANLFIYLNLRYEYTPQK